MKRALARIALATAFALSSLAALGAAESTRPAGGKPGSGDPATLDRYRKRADFNGINADLESRPERAYDWAGLLASLGSTANGESPKAKSIRDRQEQARSHHVPGGPEGAAMKTTFLSLVCIQSLVVLSGCGGAPDQQSSLAECQKYFNNTRWYWIQYQGLAPTIPGYQITDNHGMQAFVTSPSQADIIYSELSPSNGMKSFRGIGSFKKVPQVKEPIFEVESDYTQRNPNTILLIGFAAGRLLQIEARHAKNNRAQVLQEALAVAQQAHRQLVDQAKGTSKVVLAGLALVPAKAGDETSVAKIMSAMRSGTYAKQYDVYAIPKIGTNDIPELLTLVGNTNVLKSFPINRVSSIGRLACNEGMIVLWLIEGVRIGGQFPSLVPVCYDKSKSVSEGAMFYAEANQDAVAKAYLSWWEKTKGQSRDIGPLDGTALTWSGERIPADNKRTTAEPPVGGNRKPALQPYGVGCAGVATPEQTLKQEST